MRESMVCMREKAVQGGERTMVTDVRNHETARRKRGNKQ